MSDVEVTNSLRSDRRIHDPSGLIQNKPLWQLRNKDRAKVSMIKPTVGLVDLKLCFQLRWPQTLAIQDITQITIHIQD